jgi:DNA-binding response OmpR family regulator
MKDGKYVVLYIDDDPDVIETIGTVLRAAGYLAVPAGSAEEGLRLYKQVKPDFVIVDLMMEEVDAGAHFAKELKALGNKVPLYMLSSVGDQISMSVNPVELGLDGVFQKPIDFKLLRRTLETRLGPATP